MIFFNVYRDYLYMIQSRIENYSNKFQSIKNLVRGYYIMKSVTIYNCSTFNITDSKTILQSTTSNQNISKKIPVGNIAPNAKDSIIVNKAKIIGFDCTYNITINDSIIALVNGDYIPVEQYQKSNSFPAFYSVDTKKLFVFAPSPIAQGFIKALSQTYPAEVTIKSPLDYDFNKIKVSEKYAKALYFKVDETQITSKHFFGAGVEQDDEAADAIDQNKATYIIGDIDVSGKTRTIGFSKKGTVVFYSKPNDMLNLEYPYLQLTTDTLIAIQCWK